MLTKSLPEIRMFPTDVKMSSLLTPYLSSEFKSDNIWNRAKVLGMGIAEFKSYREKFSLIILNNCRRSRWFGISTVQFSSSSRRADARPRQHSGLAGSKCTENPKFGGLAKSGKFMVRAPHFMT